ncbi:MAG: hypothetical protein JEY91_05355 [Spirochaetaceae bacterium]|nr:hypothetical protein [Spirochaetaceae bacterium]
MKLKAIILFICIMFFIASTASAAGGKVQNKIRGDMGSGNINQVQFDNQENQK